MNDKERLVAACLKGLTAKKKADQPHLDRLKTELVEVEAQNEHEYILGLVDKKIKYASNPNNLLIYYALDIVPDFDIETPPATTMGEFPDIDIDYLKPVRDYLKNDWAPKNFGSEYVCSIGSYSTFGIKSTLTMMAKVHGYDQGEIKAITTKIGLKDEDGKSFTLDSAIAQFPALKAYADDKPEVIEATRRLLNRNMGMGKHAGGLIISSKPISDLVPLILSKDDGILSAWVEGLHGQDLGPVGLIKFDLLVIAALDQICNTCRLVKERRKLDYICSKPGLNMDWSDISYLNDEAAIDMANAGDLLGIFQFDSEGIRRLVKGSVTSFDDLAAFSALYRPGPMGCGMHDTYVRRKNGSEEYQIYDCLKPILSRTYGVMAFQEQVMQVLLAVGKVPLKDGYDVIKAISKKKIDKFAKHKDVFLVNGQEVLNCSLEEVSAFWDQIEAFAGYGFNKSHSVAYTYISSRQLYLKAHYPEEFYCSLLGVEKKVAKLKEYKLDAQRYDRDVKVKPVSINRSKVDFAIHKNSIYYGLADLKGVGTAVAQKVVDNQPYTSFEDFLRKFGTDSKVCMPAIGLGLFKGDRRLNHLYYEFYKKELGKSASMRKNYAKSKGKHLEKLRLALPFAVEPEELGFDDERFENILGRLQGQCDTDDAEAFHALAGDFETKYKELVKLQKAYNKTVKDYEAKIANDVIASIHDFPHDQVKVDEVELERYEKHISVAEREHYGFLWHHPLEELEGYRGKTIDAYMRAVEDEGVAVWNIEVGILGVTQKLTKKAQKARDDLKAVLKAKGKEISPLKPGEKVEGAFYVLQVEDASGEAAGVTVWGDDYDRFEQELQPGNLVSLRVRPPHPPFPNFTLESWPKHLRYKMPPVDKDYRVSVLQWAEEG